MIRLKKYTKPYLPMIGLAILLLFGQANLDLALPDYLSDIVDVGIQQGGVDDAVPIAIRQTQLERAMIFMNDSEETTINSYYTLIDENASSYDSNLEKYPILENESIYILNDISKYEKDVINIILARNLLIVYSLQQFITNSSIASEMNITLDINMSAFPPGTDLFFVLAGSPEEALNEISTGIRDEDIFPPTLILW